MGDQGGRAGYGAKVFALDRTTGETRWVTQLHGGLPIGKARVARPLRRHIA